MPDRRGLSLIEVVVALAILGIGAASILGSLQANRDQYLRLDTLFTGRILAQSVMAQALHRFHVQDKRFFQLKTTPAALLLGTMRREWEKPFLALAQPRTRVLSPHGERNPYFDPDTGPPRPAGLADSDERAFWEGFSYEVRVSFNAQITRDGPPVPLDADGDGRGETDLARLEVAIYFGPPGRPALDRSICTLSTLLHAPDKTPGLSAFSGL